MSSVQTSLLNGMNTSGLEKLGLTEAQIAGIMKQTADGITKKTTGGGTARVRKERVIPAEGDRCMARTWGSAKAGNEGMGPQCTAKKCGGDYCKMHAKKAAESEEPCQWKDGKKFGLWCGRIDKPLTGQDADGKWNIIWLHPDMKEKMAQEKEAGTFELGPAELKKASKKSSGPKKPREKKAPKEKKEKAPKVPRGKNAYMFYLESRRAAIKAQIEAEAKADGASAEAKEKLTAKGSVKVSEVTKVAGAEWKALAADAKAPFEKQAANDKAQKLAEFAKSQPAAPPAAPGPAVAAPTVDAETILKSLEVNSIALSPGGNKDVFGTDSEDEQENEGPWSFTLPDEHQLTPPEDADADFDPTDAAVCRIGDKHYVVPITWYDEAEEDDLLDEEKVIAAHIGMVNNPVYPKVDGGELNGTYSPKA